MAPDPTGDLRRYLDTARQALAWKLEGLSEYDVRRPLTPTGTNLLGLVKHLAGVEAAYLGEVFGRPFPEPLPWVDDDADVGADMWATPEESRDDLLALYRRVWAHGDVTVEQCGPDTVGRVPWWPAERAEVTLQQILVHLVAEVNRHCGHADIVRELVDGAVGHRAAMSNTPDFDEASWADRRRRLEAAARQAGGFGSD